VITRSSHRRPDPAVAFATGRSQTSRSLRRRSVRAAARLAAGSCRRDSHVACGRSLPRGCTSKAIVSEVISGRAGRRATRVSLLPGNRCSPLPAGRPTESIVPDPCAERVVAEAVARFVPVEGPKRSCGDAALLVAHGVRCRDAAMRPSRSSSAVLSAALGPRRAARVSQSTCSARYPSSSRRVAATARPSPARWRGGRAPSTCARGRAPGHRDPVASSTTMPEGALRRRWRQRPQSPVEVRDEEQRRVAVFAATPPGGTEDEDVGPKRTSTESASRVPHDPGVQLCRDRAAGAVR